MFVANVGGPGGGPIKNSAMRGEVVFYYDTFLQGIKIGSIVCGSNSSPKKKSVDFGPDGQFVLKKISVGNSAGWMVIQELVLSIGSGPTITIGAPPTVNATHYEFGLADSDYPVSVDKIYAGTRVNAFEMTIY